jgi:uncharacterized protein
VLLPVIYISVLLFSLLPDYRILLVWIYNNARSLLLVLLMLAPLSASQLAIVPLTLSGIKQVVYDMIFGMSLWVLEVVELAASPKILIKPETGKVKA